MWIEKIRDPATDSVFVTIYEYVGPLAGEERATTLSLTSSSSSPSSAQEVEGLASGTQSLVAFLEGLEREEQEELAEKKRREEEGREDGAAAGTGAAELDSSSSPSSKISA